MLCRLLCQTHENRDVPKKPLKKDDVNLFLGLFFANQSAIVACLGRHLLRPRSDGRRSRLYTFRLFFLFCGFTGISFVGGMEEKGIATSLVLTVPHKSPPTGAGPLYHKPIHRQPHRGKNIRRVYIHATGTL